MTSNGGQITSRARVAAAVLAAQLLEDEQTVKFARLRFHVQLMANRTAVFQPRDLHRQITGRDGAGDLRPAAVLHQRREREGFDHGRT